MKRRDFLKLIGVTPFAASFAMRAVGDRKPKDGLSYAELDKAVQFILEGNGNHLSNDDFDREILNYIARDKLINQNIDIINNLQYKLVAGKNLSDDEEC